MYIFASMFMYIKTYVPVQFQHLDKISLTFVNKMDQG